MAVLSTQTAAEFVLNKVCVSHKKMFSSGYQMKHFVFKLC